MSSYYERYTSGEHKPVWDEISSLCGDDIGKSNIEDISAVVTETMLRVRYNVDLLYQKLLASGYKFLDDCESARSYPNEETENQILLIENSIKRMGYLSLSVKEFYRMVGGVNFVWDYKNYPEEMWFQYADPLYVVNLTYLAKDASRVDWKEDMEANISDGYTTSAYLAFAADYYHKDNVSGGPEYGIELSRLPYIDTKILFSEYNTTFVDYLRHCFIWGGFPRVAIDNRGCEKRISYLKEGLKPI